MPTLTKRSPKIRFEFVAARKQSTLGGLPALEALARQFDLWQKIRALPGLAPRTRTSHGYSPELIVAQLLYSFCSGGASLADAERLNDEPLVRQLARVKKFADPTQLGQWLRQQNDTSIARALEPQRAVCAVGHRPGRPRPLDLRRTRGSVFRRDTDRSLRTVPGRR
jgi:hypothetical protein